MVNLEYLMCASNKNFTIHGSFKYLPKLKRLIQHENNYDEDEIKKYTKIKFA